MADEGLSHRSPSKIEIFKQIGREFWLPFLLAVIWTFFSFHRDPQGDARKTILLVISNFSGCFFLASWASGQYFRVNKQTRTERGLERIIGRLEHVVTELGRVSSSVQTSAAEVAATVTGGQSFAYAEFVDYVPGSEAPAKPATARIRFVHVGAHAIPDSSFKVRNIEIFNRDYRKGMGATVVPGEEDYAVGPLGIHTTKTVNAEEQLSASGISLFVIEGFLSNGITVQYLTAHVVNGKLLQARRVIKRGAVLMEQIDSDFPKRADGKPDMRLETYDATMRD